MGAISSVLAKHVPQFDRWNRRRILVEHLIEESRRHEEKASEWGRRGHWERAAYYKKMAAESIREVMDIKITRQLLERYNNLLRDAIVSYSVEIGHAGRYDPALHYQIYKTALQMGNPKLARKHYGSLQTELSHLISDPNLELIVRLNRVKRTFLEGLWEGKEEIAFRSANEAIALAKSLKNTASRICKKEETLAAAEQRLANLHL